MTGCVLFTSLVNTAQAEVLPSADAPQFMTVAEGQNATATIILPAKPAEVEQIAADKLVVWAKKFAGVELKIKKGAPKNAKGNYILLGTPKDQPLIAELANLAKSSNGVADTEFLSDEGFAIETIANGDARFLVIAGKNPVGVFHGAIYARDFLLDIQAPAKGVIVRQVKFMRSPALAVRGPYLLTQYGNTMLFTLEHWKHIIDMMAEGGINQIHWWIAGMYQSKKYPESFEIANSKMSVDDIRELIRYSHARGMKFLVGGGGFSWHGINNISLAHPEMRTQWGICPSNPVAQEYMTGYAMDWLETFPEADGLWIEPRDEHGLCRCDACMKSLDQYSSRQYGQSEMVWMKELMKKVWAKNPKYKLVWLIELVDKPEQAHADDPLYFERIREIKDPRFEWMVVWEAFKLVGPRNERTPVPFFSRNMLHWDLPYWPNLQNVFEHARICTEQGYLGYSNAWTAGWNTNDWYNMDIPYPVDLIPDVITSLGFREACWEPAQTWEDFVGRVHRRFFSSEVPRSMAEEMLFLRQYVTDATHFMVHTPIETFFKDNTLAAEVARIKALPAEQQKAALDKLVPLIDILQKTRDEYLARWEKLEADMSVMEPTASAKSKDTFALMRRAIADDRKAYATVVPDAAAFEQILKDVNEMKQPKQ